MPEIKLVEKTFYAPYIRFKTTEQRGCKWTTNIVLYFQFVTYHFSHFHSSVAVDSIIWNIKLCCWVSSPTYCSIRVAWSAVSSRLRLLGTWFFETLGTTHPTTQHHKLKYPESSFLNSLYIHRTYMFRIHISVDFLILAIPEISDSHSVENIILFRTEVFCDVTLHQWESNFHHFKASSAYHL
jgi:hypothetical protein